MKRKKKKKDKIVWTHFWDMHSGGRQKEEFAHCFIEAPEKEAKIIFQNLFGHNPERVTCTCCGEDYSISETDESLEEATAFHRNCRFVHVKKEDGGGHYTEEPDPERVKYGLVYLTFKKYLQKRDVKVIYAKDIKPKDRQGELRKEGYVWVN